MVASGRKRSWDCGQALRCSEIVYTVYSGNVLVRKLCIHFIRELYLSWNCAYSLFGNCTSPETVHTVYLGTVFVWKLYIHFIRGLSLSGNCTYSLFWDCACPEIVHSLFGHCTCPKIVHIVYLGTVLVRKLCIFESRFYLVCVQRLQVQRLQGV